MDDANKNYDELKRKYDYVIMVLQAIAQREYDYGSRPFLDCSRCARITLKKLGEDTIMKNKKRKRKGE